MKKTKRDMTQISFIIEKHKLVCSAYSGKIF